MTATTPPPGATKLTCGHYTKSGHVAVYPGGRKRWRCPTCNQLVARAGR